jgi:hypothetical protein
MSAPEPSIPKNDELHASALQHFRNALHRKLLLVES